MISAAKSPQAIVAFSQFIPDQLLLSPLIEFSAELHLLLSSSKLAIVTPFTNEVSQQT